MKRPITFSVINRTAPAVKVQN